MSLIIDLFDWLDDEYEASHPDDPAVHWNKVDEKLWESKEERYSAYARYRELIRENNITDIEQIAKIVNKPTLRAQVEIQSMIYHKYIIGMHVDIKTNTIVPGDDPNHVPEIAFKLSAKGSEVIICKNCGASNPVTSQVCEYCDTRLK